MGKMRNWGWLLAAIVALVAAGCTAGGGGDTAGTPVVMKGVMLKGSVILNGVHFEIPPGTSITVDGSAGSDVNLKDGMVVTLKGTDNGNGTGTLEKLATSDELQGQVQTVNAATGTLQVLDQTIYVDDQTKYGNLASGLASLVVLVDYVEVHGLRDSTGAIRATRVEKLTGTPDVELKGIISSVTATTFQIGTLVITYTGATIVPTGTTLVNDMRVEARLSGPTTASLVKVEDLTEDPDLQPAEGAEVRIEGYVTAFTATPGTFQVNGEVVQTTASTEFKNGSSGDLRNDVSVEVEGTMSGGVLVAHEVKFERLRIKIEGTVTPVDADTITVFGATIKKTAFTEVGLAWPTVTGRFKIEAYADQAGTTFYADKIESTGGGDDVLQAPVQANIASPTYRLTLLGRNIDFPGSGVTYHNDDDVSITRDQFFAAASVGTLVKVKFDGATTTPKEAELEN